MNLIAVNLHEIFKQQTTHDNVFMYAELLHRAGYLLF